jgi:hypothetical protein
MSSQASYFIVEVGDRYYGSTVRGVFTTLELAVASAQSVDYMTGVMKVDHSDHGANVVAAWRDYHTGYIEIREITLDTDLT